MPSPELATIIEMFTTMDPLGAGSIEAIRAGMEQTPPYPQPDDIAWEAVDAGGVPAEWNVPTDAAEGRTIVYFHGGGYAIGGIEGHRGLCSNLALAVQKGSVDHQADQLLLDVGFPSLLSRRSPGNLQSRAVETTKLFSQELHLLWKRQHDKAA